MNGGIGDSPPRELYEAGPVDVDLAAHAGHSHHGDVCPTPGSCFPVPGDQFDTFADLENRLKVHSLDHGFTLARSTHLFSSTLALELFRVKSPLIKVVHRGSFYCSYKVCPDDSTKKCSWRITFTFDRTLLKYVIKTERYCSMHSHEIGEEAASSSAIHRESQLYEAELDQIQAMALQDLSIPEIRSRMQATYPGKDYTPDLLRRIVKKTKDHAARPATADDAASTSQVRSELRAMPPRSVPTLQESEQESRYLEVHQRFNQIVSKVINDPHRFKLFSLNLVAFEHSLTNPLPVQLPPSSMLMAPAPYDRPYTATATSNSTTTSTGARQPRPKRPRTGHESAMDEAFLSTEMANNPLNHL
ncbi:hypothetical protein SDRG_09146 [Saprolegnia diclina VS20]|uniref:Uncharacterized protein n=1 Tax=Saprolegnia diclina (strain VS20) TaxID=1156394 RepID=T0QHK1_SAPDV|nr:hypothetical protein SDRG_09146 [Saprolegnia diclina VS20]EQC33160.1 hypothetical protein SDRG_09146 [Saprolegnia diclina VS20]|eukprot:XP_008613283.1 hypothetical protein SDRG_09146 [Saprolegnia diclina VS20]